MTREGYYQYCGIYRKWHTHSFADFTNDTVSKEKVLKYLHSYRKAVKDGVGLFLYGDNGVGKSLLMNLSFMDLIEKRQKVRIVALSELIGIFTGSWYEEEKRDALDLIRNVAFLGIEEIGKEFRSTFQDKDSKNSDLIVTVLDNILRYRVQNNLPTWFTSNLSPKLIESKYSHDIFSMLKEHCVPIKVTGEDFRNNIDIHAIIE